MAPISINGTTGISGVDGSAGTPALQGSDTNTGIAFGSDVIIGSTDGTERFRCDSSGRVLVGTSNAYGQNYLQIQGDQTNGSTGFGGISLRRGVAPASIGDGSQLGFIDFGPNDGGVGARIAAWGDALNGTNDYPARLVFSTTADGASSPTERMRISSGGEVRIGFTGGIASGQVFSLGVQNNTKAAAFHTTASSGYSAITCSRDNNGAVLEAFFQTTQVGSISVSSTTTTYNTSSDYRLKENVTAVTDGITRLQQLKPSRFNFIADPERTVDGFIAHEVQAVVPECVTGEKDAVDEDGNPVYQGIDQSKLVPLLTAALQEAVAKIESLETRIAALEVTP